MVTTMLDPRHVARIALDTGTTKSIAEPASRNRSRLVPQWQRNAEGQLVCAWHRICPDEADLSGTDLSHETCEAGRRTNMTQVHTKALEVEALAYSNLSGANDAQSPALPSQAASAPAAQQTSRARAVIQWIAIASLLAVAGLEMFLSFAIEPNGLL
jgi:hypothetical protein